MSASMPDYGKLSGRSLDEMIAGARVEVAPYKRDPMDFVLWKPSKPGEPSWPSPCRHRGAGAPRLAHRMLGDGSWQGGHLGETFDIHGGGIDLVFPHHENEIAQSRCANRTPIMAQVWMHNGFLQVEGEKMAKSAGNFVTVHELLEGWQGYALARRGASLQHAAHAVSPAAGLDAWSVSTRRIRRCGNGMAISKAKNPQPAFRGRCSMRSRTTSTRPRRSPSCTGCTAPVIGVACARRSASSDSRAEQVEDRARARKDGDGGEGRC